MSDSKRLWTVPLVFCLLFSLLIYSQTYFGKRVDAQPPVENISVPAEVELKAQVDKSFGKIPIRFEANLGQTDERVQFLARDKGYSLFLTPEEAVMVLPIGPEKSATVLSGSVKKVSLNNNENDGTRHAAIRMSLLNANPAPEMFGEDEQITKSNYFIGSDPAKWRTSVGNYGRVRYEEAYPGIDLIYYGNPHQLEYDFVVSPGAALDVIKIKFEGQDGLELDAAGNLILKVGSGRVVQNAPIVYQFMGGKRVSVQGRYVLLGADSVGFRIGEYDRGKDLVIDPQIEFSTYLGSGGFEEGRAIAVDSSGNAYVVGGTDSTDFPTVGAFQSSLAGESSDVFIVKLNAEGSAVIYSTYFGGTGVDKGNSIALDSSGNVYITGYTQSTDFPVVSAVDNSRAASQDSFVAKLNASGSALVYSTYLGGDGAIEEGKGISVDSSGNAYVVGITDSTDFPTVGADTTFGGVTDAFVSKLNSTGSALVYSAYLGGSKPDSGNAIAVDSTGNAYISGATASNDFPTTAGGFNTAFGGIEDAFVSKLNSVGSALIYSTFLGGVDLDIANGIALDSMGNLYITGWTRSMDFPIIGGVKTTLERNGSDAFVSKLNAAGSSLTYSTYLGGRGTDQGKGIALDSAGNVFITGRTLSFDFPTVGAFQPTLSKVFDTQAFLVEIDPSGSSLVLSTYLGGSGFDIGNDVAVDPLGNVYLVGDTTSSDILILNAIDSTFGHPMDAFVVKVTTDSINFEIKPDVVSPYWQADAGIYTFLAVSHPSLSGMNSEIGVGMAAFNDENSLKGTLAFTVSSGQTQRLFITGPSFIISPGSVPKVKFLVMNTTGSESGTLKFSNLASNPEIKLGGVGIPGSGFSDIRSLTFWGIIGIAVSGTGFAMEFIGDMQDSRAFSSANFSGVN